jgi:ribulose 1,5-bisphosphate synthetase/thiazole synthase
VLGGLWAAFCLAILVGGCVASYTSDDTYVDTGAIAVTLAMMALALGGSVWVAGLLVIKIFVKEEA